MINTIKDSIWQQFGASIDMLKHAVIQWPEESWTGEKKFFYMSYHTIIFLDYYLTLPPPKVFSSPLAFTYTEPGNRPANATGLSMTSQQKNYRNDGLKRMATGIIPHLKFCAIICAMFNTMPLN